jgi:DNA polymerase
MLCADQPIPWLDAEEQAAPALSAAASPPLQPGGIVPSTTHDTTDDQALCSAPTLGEFLDRFRALHPGAPIADGVAERGILIIGEGPSAEDLRTGRPFTGPAGRLLDRMLAAIGLDRNGCYIVLAAPRRLIPGPVPAEALAADRAVTVAHIRLAAPRLILMLGGPASTLLTGNPAPIGRQRGQWQDVDRVPALPTYNPAYLLRRPDAKREAWADLLSFQRRLSLPCAS